MVAPRERPTGHRRVRPILAGVEVTEDQLDSLVAARGGEGLKVGRPQFGGYRQVGGAKADPGGHRAPQMPGVELPANRRSSVNPWREAISTLLRVGSTPGGWPTA